MKFILIDKIERIDLPGHSAESPAGRIIATKSLSLAEEYLADHFPAFPVLPGVMMVEAMVQSAAWLVRVVQDWSRSVVVLSAARNVKYARFVHPGDTLRCDLQAIEIGPDGARFKGVGAVGDQVAVSGRLELRCVNLADQKKAGPEVDAAIVKQLRGRFGLIGGPEAVEKARR
jgi:3-hydroxyacyl-[acyl-carrier-protein] dehydratase